MKKYQLYITALFVLLIITGLIHFMNRSEDLKIYEYNAKDENIDILYEAISRSDAGKQAEIDYRRGDYRFVGYNSVAVITPYASSTDRKTYGYKVIAGTTDRVNSSRVRKYMIAAKRFAEDYNQSKQRLNRKIKRTNQP